MLMSAYIKTHLRQTFVSVVYVSVSKVCPLISNWRRRRRRHLRGAAAACQDCRRAAAADLSWPAQTSTPSPFMVIVDKSRSVNNME